MAEPRRSNRANRTSVSDEVSATVVAPTPASRRPGARGRATNAGRSRSTATSRSAQATIRAQAVQARNNEIVEGMQPPPPFVPTPFIPPQSQPFAHADAHFSQPPPSTTTAAPNPLQPHVSRAPAQTTPNFTPTFDHQQGGEVHRGYRVWPSTTSTYDPVTHATSTPPFRHDQQGGQASTVYGLPSSIGSSFTYADATNSAPMASSLHAGPALDMPWADPQGAFDYDSQYTDAMGTFGIQDHLRGDEDDEGYGDGNADGDTTLQPHPDSHNPSMSSNDDFFTNLFLQEQSQSQRPTSEITPGQYFEQMYRTSTRVPEAADYPHTTTAPPVLERHLPYPPPAPSSSINQQVLPQELRRRMTEPTHAVSNVENDTVGAARSKRGTHLVNPYTNALQSRRSISSRASSITSRSVNSAPGHVLMDIMTILSGSQAGSASKQIHYSSEDMVNINYATRLYLIEHYKLHCWPTTAQKNAWIGEIMPMANSRARRNGKTTTELTPDIAQKLRHSGAFFRNAVREAMHRSLDCWGIYVTKQQAKTMSLVDQEAYTAAKVAAYLDNDSWRDVGLDDEGNPAFLNNPHFVDAIVSYIYGPDGIAQHAMHIFYPRFTIPGIALFSTIIFVCFLEMASGKREKITLNHEELYKKNLDEYKIRDANMDYHHHYISKTLRQIAKAGKALIDSHRNQEATGSRPRIATSGVRVADFSLRRDPNTIVNSDSEDES